MVLGGELRTGGGWLGGGLLPPGRAQAQTKAMPLLQREHTGRLICVSLNTSKVDATFSLEFKSALIC